MRTLFVLLVLVPGLLPSAAAAQARADSGAFVVRLGVDTIGMERYRRTSDRIEVTLLARSPRTVVRRVTYVLGPDGSVTQTGVATGDQTVELRPVNQVGAVPLVGGAWVSWELVLERVVAARGQIGTINVLAGTTLRPTPVQRTGPGTYALTSQFDQPMAAQVDERGRLLRLEILGGGSTVERVPALDLDRWAREFAARDAAGTGLGPLSPRDSTSGAIRGATITIAYGRPALRGRPLEVLVPLGQVWRTGANDATILTTDRELRFDGLTLPAGSYSLFTLPETSGWTLIVNRQTGMSGLERDPARDLGRVRMHTRTDAPHTERFTIEVRRTGEGGTLVLRWGSVEAAARFTIGG